MPRLLFSMLLLALPLMAEEWEECRTGPFEIWTNASEKDARVLLVRLEQMRYMLGQYLGKPDPVSLWTVRVLLVKGKAADGAKWTLGRDAWVSVMAAGTQPTRAWQKELARMLLVSNARRMPRYWEEGLVDFLSTLDAQGPKITLGTPPPVGERTLDWARLHFFATNPEYAGRFRVLLNNVQQGADEDVAYRNSLGQTKKELEALVAKHFAGGQFTPAILSGRPIVEKDFSMRPVEAERVSAALEDGTGKAESVEARGMATRSLELLKQAVEAGTKSARVYLEYGKALKDQKAKQDAFVEAAKKNPRWGEPYIELANLETTAARQSFYLKTAAALDQRNSALWQRLARAQLEAKEFSDASKSWFSAELAASTAEERAAVSTARRQFETERLDREESERKRIADERQAELDRLKLEALNAVRAAEAKANKGVTPLDPAKKVEEWWDDKQGSQKVTGELQRVDCLGKAARVWVKTAGTAKAVALWIKDPGQVVILGGGETSLGCGVQKPARTATVEYKPRADSKQGTAGDVTVIEFR